MLKELRVFNQDNITKIYKLEDSKARMSMSIEGETTIMYFVLEDLGIETSDYDDVVFVRDIYFEIEVIIESAVIEEEEIKECDFKVIGGEMLIGEMLIIEYCDYDDMKEVNIEDWMFDIENNPDDYEEEGMRKIMKKISELEFDKILMPN